MTNSMSTIGAGRRTVVALAIFGTVFALAGCSQTVSKTDVEKEISAQLTQQVGAKPDSVTCPEDLKGTEGATLRCELTDKGDKYGVTVTVNSVHGSDVKFGFKVDDHPEK